MCLVTSKSGQIANRSTLLDQTHFNGLNWHLFSVLSLSYMKGTGKKSVQDAADFGKGK